MDCLSAVTLIVCFVSISIVMQGADAQDKCTSPEMMDCRMIYDGAVGIAEGDKKMICSAAKTFLDCLNKVVTDCKLSDPSVVSQTIAPGKQALSDNKCGGGNSAGSLVFNLFAMVSGLIFHKLFR